MREQPTDLMNMAKSGLICELDMQKPFNQAIRLANAVTEMAQKRIEILEWAQYGKAPKTHMSRIETVEVEFLLYNGWGQRVWVKQELFLDEADQPRYGDSASVVLDKHISLVTGVTRYVESLREGIDKVLVEEHLNTEHAGRFARVKHVQWDHPAELTPDSELDLMMIANTKIKQN